MSRIIQVSFPIAGVTARIELLPDAPRTCDRLWDALPIKTSAVHAIYSGSEVVCFLDRSIEIAAENLTTCVLPGDIGYTYIPGGRYMGVPDPIAEIAIFYGRDASPRQPEGPWPMNIFGRVIEGLDALAEVCKDTRWGGAKPVTFDRADG